MIVIMILLILSLNFLNVMIRFNALDESAIENKSLNHNHKD